MKRFPSTATDCHQHRWTPALVAALRARSAPPRLDGWTLHLVGEAPFDVGPQDRDEHRRRALDDGDGLGLVLLSLSSALGVERLRPDEAAPLLDAWHAGADTLGEQEAIWAAVGLVEPELDRLAELLTHPRVAGLQLPADALADPARLASLAPVLAVAERADRPVLVHPGPVSPTPDVPAWWPALVDYPAQLAAAWHAWHVAGRSLLPRLRIAFVALAGLAPLHHERMRQRGGDPGPVDPHVYYETSSYGARAVDAMTRVVGVDPLVHGSDRPYATPLDLGLGAALDHAVRVANPHHLLNGGSR